MMRRAWHLGIIYFVLPFVASSADTAAAHQFRTSCAPCHGPQGEGGRGPALAVTKLPRAPDDAALAAIITNGIPGTQMPGTRMTDDERAALVHYVRQLGAVTPAAVDGDIRAGEQLFWGKAECGRCHTVGPRGGRLGPDLTEIGLRRSPAHLRAVLLDPAANIPDGFTVYRRVVFQPDNFVQVRIRTKSGETIVGARIDEDAFTIQLRDYSGRLHSFRKDELVSVDKEWGKTPMPAYGSTLSGSDIRDLVAYLSNLRNAGQGTR